MIDDRVLGILIFVLLVPIEESRLLSAYGESYAVYQRDTRRLVPFVY